MEKIINTEEENPFVQKQNRFLLKFKIEKEFTQPL